MGIEFEFLRSAIDLVLADVNNWLLLVAVEGPAFTPHRKAPH